MSPRMILVLALVLSAPVAAQVASDAPRFELAPREAGVTRIDTRTGVISRCAPHEGSWSCEALSSDESTASADAAAKTASEVGRVVDALTTLSARVDVLTRRLDELAPPVPAIGPSETHAPRASLVTEVVARFMEMVRRLRHPHQG